MNKRIFKYHDGTKDRKADPLKSLRLLWESLPQYGGAVDAYFSGDPEKRFPAQAMLAEAARQVFGLKEFVEETEEGLTEEMCLEVLWDLHDLLEKKNPDTESTPTSPPPTDSPLSCTSPELTTG
jgi:hypothetical protein